MSLAETLAWLQGVCHNIIEQRANCAYRWGQLGHVLASTLSSFETAAQICLAYLPSVPRRTLSARAPAGSSCRCLAPGPLPLVCPENPSDDEQSSCDEDESSSFGDTHSLPDFLLSDIEENYEYGLPNATADTTMSEGDTEPNLPIVSASVLVEHMLEQSLKHAAYNLTKHVFLRPPRPHGLPHHRRFSTYYGATSRKHRSSVGCLPAQLSVALHARPSSGFFRTTTPLLLPAPVFLPEALEIGLFCEKGTRAHNEDMAFTMKLDSSVHSCFQQAVCMGVFDGHGGVDVAAHLTECLPELVAKRCKHIKEQGVQEVATIMLGLEDDLCARYHREWQPAGRDPGSTALVATIMDDLLLIANVGDCRLLLISEAADNLGNRTAFVAKATCDHHCARNKDEAQRIRTAGAHVDAAGYIGSLLEVSRSLGDFQTKGELGKDVIISEPEVYTWKLGPQDLMAVAVTDGISGSMDDMEICNMVCKLLNDKKHLNDPAFAARELANFAAFAKGSSDNCSAVVVVLKDQPPPEPARRRLFGRK